ncbi:MAG: hypothetical protein LBQ20_09260 [Rhodanobacter sp.]|jgi:hypothetical protein|nr:hypothetical protein [Rhodanobacter sp.]
MDNPYHEIDNVISQWVEKHKFTLFTGYQGRPEIFRSVYLGHVDECCQIWIDPPQDGIVGVHTADVESRNDEPMRMDWASPISMLSATLELAVDCVRTWFIRSA